MQNPTTTQHRGFPRRDTGKEMRRRRPLSGPAAVQAAPECQLQLARENWWMDAHWTAVASYLAQMDIPNEG